MAFAAPGPMPRSGFGLHLPEIGPVRAAADQGIMSAVLPWGAIADRHGERVALPAGPAWATAILPLGPPPIRRSMGFLSGEEERRLLPLEPVAPSAPVLDLGRMSAATSAVYHSRFALNDAPLRKWSIGSTPKVETTFGSDALAHRAEKWTRFSAPNDALLKKRSIGMGRKSGVHFFRPML